jgi:hypothetical protein
VSEIVLRNADLSDTGEARLVVFGTVVEAQRLWSQNISASCRLNYFRDRNHFVAASGYFSVEKTLSDCG